jgi:hypothetical protein
MDKFWSAAKSADPTDPANWYTEGVPKAGDTVFQTTNVMYLKGHVLDGTDFHIGFPVAAGVTAPFGPVLNVSEDATLKVTVEGYAGNGNDVTINVFGHDTINLTTATGWYDNPLTKTTTTMNIADSSTLTGTLNLGGSKFTMNKGGEHGVFFNEGTSYLTHANQDVVKITPDILGTGEFKMVFSNLELGGLVGPGQKFDLIGSDSLIVDHADTFKGSVQFLAEAGSTLTFKDVFTNDYSYDGKTVTFHQPGKIDIGVGVTTDYFDNLHVQNTSAGTELWVTHVT